MPALFRGVVMPTPRHPIDFQSRLLRSLALSPEFDP
jgi:hypothetical protein